MAKRLRVIEEVIVDGDQSFRKEKEDFEEENTFTKRESQRFQLCGDGHLIHSSLELVGRCACGRFICKACEPVRCSLDGLLVHRRCALIDGEKVVCRRHGFFRTLAFSFFGK